jgi:peptidoglycan/LPS O-acetylase OafA/YrhL|uniref:acyltransferase family protein n=1 Tax=Altererythrobacter segetis TaxID=1104773 RepID=UPI00140B5895|nr:acyltransferase [Altererythrobacter segetis]
MTAAIPDEQKAEASGPLAISAAGTHLRVPELDGWRATSILLVLAGHLLPLGPHALGLNNQAALMGMSLFFAISGFLIVRFLAEGMPVPAFAARRLSRILPLSWTAMAAVYVMSDAGAGKLVANLLFYANLPPARLMHGGEHLWSLCVEVQFYAVAAALALLPRRRGLYLVTLLGLLVTALRVQAGEPISIITWHRVDEILAGGTIALVYCGWYGVGAQALLRRTPVAVAVAAWLLCSHPASGPLLYIRPYAAALVIGTSLQGVAGLPGRLLTSRPMAYIAEISYALYVIHGILTVTWLGSGPRLEKYAKRPLLFAATFALAHLSTRYFERPFVRLGRRITSSPKRVSPQPESI